MRHGGRGALVALTLATAVTALAACTEPAGRPLAPDSPGAIPRTQPVTPGPTTTLAPRPHPPQPADPPNILLLLTDDQAFTDLSVMARTTRRLRKEGTEFTRAFSAYPLCCPARATLLTGQHAHNHGVLGNTPPWGGLTELDESRTLPLWLQAAGYRTATLGKYLHGYPETTGAWYVPPGWDDWHVPVVNAYDYYDYTLNENGVLHSYSGTYQTDFVRDRATTLVKELAADDRPFFFWVNFLAPHVGLPREPDDPRTRFGSGAVDTPTVAPRHRDTMAGRRVPRTAALDERDVSDKQKFVRLLPHLPFDQLDEAHQQRLESLLAVDEAVDRILRELKRSGEYDDTLIVFASDNGYSLGQHRWAGKVLGYEESARIPLLVAGPGIAAGVRRNQLVSLADLTATFLDVSRATPRRRQDGISLLPLSHDPAVAADRALLLEAGGWPYPKQQRLYSGIRTADDRVLLRWYTGFEEVYDLSRDPLQLNGRASKAERRWVPELRRALKMLERCRGAACNQARPR